MDFILVGRLFVTSLPACLRARADEALEVNEAILLTLNTKESGITSGGNNTGSLHTGMRLPLQRSRGECRGGNHVARLLTVPKRKLSTSNDPQRLRISQQSSALPYGCGIMALALRNTYPLLFSHLETPQHSITSHLARKLRIDDPYQAFPSYQISNKSQLSVYYKRVVPPPETIACLKRNVTARCIPTFGVWSSGG